MQSVGRVLLGFVTTACACAAPGDCCADLVNVGDLAFIGFNEDGFDDFAIVLLADAAATDVVRFNDNEWAGAGFNGLSEGELSWTVGGTGLAAGTVVTFNSMNSATAMSVSSGALSGGTMSLNSFDNIFAFLGTNATTPTTFLAAISNDVRIYDGTNSQTLAGTGLSQGTTAVLLPDSTDGGQYTGVRSGETAFADYVALIGNTSTNWATAPSNGTQFLPFNTTSFQATAASTPEPASLSLMLLAMTMGALRRWSTAQRRRAA